MGENNVKFSTILRVTFFTFKQMFILEQAFYFLLTMNHNLFFNKVVFLSSKWKFELCNFKSSIAVRCLRFFLLCCIAASIQSSSGAEYYILNAPVFVIMRSFGSGFLCFYNWIMIELKCGCI